MRMNATHGRAARALLLPLALTGALALGACAPSYYWQPASAPKAATAELVDHRHSVHFATDSAEIGAVERARLEAFLDQLGRPTGSETVIVEGHADERATDLYNMELSSRRADAVARLLAARGWERGAIRTVAYGELVPVDARSTEQAWRQNRRAEIVVRRYVAVTPPCPDWSKPSGFDPGNTEASNFGCATATNLARMVADPADLVRGRELGPADGVREADAYRRYREGDVQALQSTRR
jgi:pilus assembly protein CpaD